MNKRGQVFVYLIVIGVLIAGWLLINNIYVTYKHEKFDSFTYSCDQGKLLKSNANDAGLGEMTIRLECSDYVDTKAKLTCEGDQLYITCSTTIYIRYFNRRTPQVWG